MKLTDLPIVRKLQRHIEANKAAKKARHDTEIVLRFRLAERDGRMFIMCYGTAVCELPQTTTVSDVSDTIAKMRQAALTYDSLDNTTEYNETNN